MLVVTSELVTNGVLHDGGDLITLRADRLDHAVVIEVMADDTTTIASMRVMYVWIHERGQPRLGGVHHRGGVRRPLGKIDEFVGIGESVQRASAAGRSRHIRFVALHLSTRDMLLPTS